MKIFGKELFNIKKEFKPMWDFAQFGLLQNNNTLALLQPVSDSSEKPKKPKKEKKPIFITPKGIYQMKALNDNNFIIKADSDYLNKQLDQLYKKLELMGKKPKENKARNGFMIGSEIGVVRYGREEIESIIERIKNRSKLDEFKEILEKYPHTTSDLLNKVISKNSNLRCQLAISFVPDFPKEAINAMKEYNGMCISLCNKKAVFYVVTEEEDFQKVNKRRDPILLAQSPFGFFWQILGAWDREMIYLGDL